MREAHVDLPGHNEKIRVPARCYVKLHPLELPFTDGMETTVFGLACFGSAERKFGKISGVCSPPMNYPGAYTLNPTNQGVCSAMTGHNGVVRVVFSASDRFLRNAVQGVLAIP